MNEEQRGVILYGHEVRAVASALSELGTRFVAVLPCPTAAEADAARERAPDIDWLVVELFLPGVEIEQARDVGLLLNISKLDAATAARAVDKSDLVTWYAITNPVRVETVDGGPVADDYSNIRVVEPDGHRSVAHAVRTGGPAPDCLPGDADRVMPSDDLWVLTELRSRVDMICETCVTRHV